MTQSGEDFRLPSAVREAIGKQLEQHRRTMALSTGSVIKELRQRFPDLEVADRQLADQIAQAAVDRGMAVDLDASSPPPAKPPA